MNNLLTATAGQTWQGIVGQADGYYNGTQDVQNGDYQVQINWGDSPSWDNGQVQPNTAPGERIPFNLQGTHTYAAAGNYIVVVQLTGPDGQTLSRQTAAIQVTAPLQGSVSSGGQPLQGGVSASPEPTPVVPPYQNPLTGGATLSDPSTHGWTVASGVQFRVGVNTTGYSLANLAARIQQASGDSSVNWPQWISQSFGPVVNSAFQNAVSKMPANIGPLIAYGTITATPSGGVRVTVTSTRVSARTPALGAQWVNQLNTQLKAIKLQ
jgi:hypothetical protein